MAGKFRWYGDRVAAVINEATDEGLSRLAFQIEAKTKANIRANGQIDTGFMLNSTYTVSRAGGSTYGQAGGGLAGVGRGGLAGIAAPEASLGRARALVAVAAAYAIYQELRRTFLFAAAAQVIGGEAKPILEGAYQERFG